MHLESCSFRAKEQIDGHKCLVEWSLPTTEVVSIDAAKKGISACKAMVNTHLEKVQSRFLSCLFSFFFFPLHPVVFFFTSSKMLEAGAHPSTPQ